MNIKYHVRLTGQEREQLKTLIADGNAKRSKIRNAQILLLLDEIPENKEWTAQRIATAHHVTDKSVWNLRRRFAEQGFAVSLNRKTSQVGRGKITAEAEAILAELTRTQPPAGYKQWSLRLLADKLIKLGAVKSVSYMTVGLWLKNTKLPHNYQKAARSNRDRSILPILPRRKILRPNGLTDDQILGYIRALRSKKQAA